MTTTENKAPENKQSEVKEIKPDFGNGKYSRVAESMFNALRFFLSLTSEQAEKVAKAYASDLGRLNMSVDSVTVGKPTTDGYVNVRENGIVKKVKYTHSFRFASIIKGCEALYKLDVSRLGEVKLSDILTEWLNS